MAKKKNLPLEDAAQRRLTLTVPDDAERAENREEDLFSQDQETAGNASEETVYLTVGDRLRIEREKRGLTPHEMADQLRLRPRQIIALEAGDYANLPGQAFVTGFLRSYANALDLDAVELVKLYKTEHEGALGAPQLAFPEPTSEGRMPASGLIVGTCLVAAIAFGGWHFYQEGSKSEAELVPELPSRLAGKLEEFTKAETVEEKQIAVQENIPVATKTAADTTTENQDSETSLAPTASTTNTETMTTVANLPAGDVTGNAVDRPASSAPDTPPAENNSAAPSSERNSPDISSPPPVVNGTDTEMIASVDETDGISSERTVGDRRSSGDTEESSVSSEQTPSAPTANPEPQTEAVVALVGTPATESTYPQAVLQSQPQTEAIATSSGTAETLGVENSDARIILLAHQETWIQVTNAEETVLLDRVLEPGDTYMVPVDDGLKLNTANAAGLEIRLDGAVLGTLGSYGRIIRDMALEPDQLKTRFATGTE